MNPRQVYGGTREVEVNSQHANDSSKEGDANYQEANYSLEKVELGAKEVHVSDISVEAKVNDMGPTLPCRAGPVGQCVDDVLFSGSRGFPKKIAVSLMRERRRGTSERNRFAWRGLAAEWRAAGTSHSVDT